jgi:hypothetical protein
LCRYPLGQLPSSDSKFLVRLQAALLQGQTDIRSREARLRSSSEALVGIEETFKQKEDLSETITQGLVDLQLSFACPVSMYLLGDDAATFMEAKADALADHGSTTTLRAIKGEARSDLIHLAARVCRHDIMIQWNNGRFSVIDCGWADATQLNLSGIEDLRAAIEEIEGRFICDRILGLCKEAFPRGVYLVPLIGFREVLVGLLLVEKIDALPQAVYRLQPDERAAGGAPGEVVEVVEAPEPG